jgi:hypothetical protein
MGSAPIPQQGTTIPTPGQPQPLQPGEWQPSASPTVVNFKAGHIEPPSAQYVQTGDQLVCTAASLTGNNDTVTFLVRLLLPIPPQPGQPDGSGLPAPGMAASQRAVIQQLVTTVAVVGGATATVKLALQEGFLLSVAAVGTNLLGRGILFLRCYLQQRAGLGAALTPSMLLFADYTDSKAPIGWPGGRILYPTEGPGLGQELTVGNPAAGADWLYTVPAGTRLRISSWSAVLTTSATVSNRFVQALIKTSAGAIGWQAISSQAIAASTTAQVSAAPGQYTATGILLSVTAPLPSPCILLAQEQIGTLTQNLQAADQWSSIRLLTESWLDNI